MCFDAKGQLIACADEHNQLWSIDPAGKATVLIKDYQGKLLNGPNDVWIHPHGEMFITDPYYKRDYWKRGPKEQAVEGVYRLSADRSALTLVVDDLQQPNGIIGTPDGTLLYVSDIKAGITYSYTVEADASLTHKKRFCDMGSDGMTIDDQGNVYLTNHGVTVFAQRRQDPAHRHRRGLDRQYLLRRRRPQAAVHHRLDLDLRPAHGHPRRRQPMSP